MIQRVVCAVFAAILTSTTIVAGVATAGCNAVPDAFTVMARGPNPTPAVVAQLKQLDALGAPFGQKVALGRVDMVDLDPGSAGKVRIRPDGICVNTPGRPEVVRRDSIPGGGDVFVSFLLERGNGRVDGLVFGSAEFCQMLTPEIAARPEQSRVGALACTSERWKVDERDGGGFDVGIELSALQQLVGPPSEDGVVRGGAVTIVAARNPESGAELRTLLERAAREGCASMCSDLLAAGGLVCAGKVYALTGSGTYQTDPIPCDMKIPPSIGFNDFGEQCDDETTSGPNLAKCGNNPSKLLYWIDDCGGVHVPFDWTGIRQDDQGNEILRELAGRTAAGRAKAGGDRRMWIPGREFIGSTPPNDPNATLSTTDWRLPEVDVWYPAGSPQSFGLIGTVDRDKSILHLYPRLKVGVLCDSPSVGTEACMAVGGRYRGNGIECACRDDYAATCTCKTVSDATYFACSDPSTPSVAGQPCTRDEHCNPTGKCNAQPFCVKKDDVWHPGAAWPANPHPCWNDDDCVGQPGNRTQCGFELFNFGTRTTFKEGELDALVDFTSPGARLERGVCLFQRSEFCRNHPTSSPDRKECPSGVGPCRGYTLGAGPKR